MGKKSKAVVEDSRFTMPPAENDNEIQVKEEKMSEDELGNDDMCDEKTDFENNSVEVAKKKSKPGIVFLSTIPPKMNVKQIREYFSKFGAINRSFLQPGS